MSNTNSYHNNPFPLFGSEEETPHPERYLSLPTATSVKNGELFGIPLISALTGQTLPDSTIENFIIKAISWLEHELGLFITPVSHNEKHDWDSVFWTQQFAHFKVFSTPLLDVQALTIKFGNVAEAVPFLNIPMEFIETTPFDGSVRVVPAAGMNMGSFLMSIFSGGFYSAVLLGWGTYFPGAVNIQYRSGFEQDKVPAIFVDLIEKKAASLLLSTLSPILFPHQSVSIGIDGVSQSVGNSGVNFLSKRIQDLQDQIQSQLASAKSYYHKDFVISYF
jgi:hypothetical protein